MDYQNALIGRVDEAEALLARVAEAIAIVRRHGGQVGGNPALAGRPIFTQRTELETATTVPDYTLPELVDADGLRYEVLDGEAEILAGVHVIPTPGHTAGHQS